GPSCPPSHAHAALWAVERAFRAGVEPAVGADHTGTTTGRRQPGGGSGPEASPGGDHLLIERAQQALSDPLGVAAQALPAPADHRSHDQVAAQLIPVARQAADDRVVV